MDDFITTLDRLYQLSWRLPAPDQRLLLRALVSLAGRYADAQGQRIALLRRQRATLDVLAQERQRRAG